MHGNKTLQIALFGAASALITSFFIQPMWKKMT